MDSKFDIYHKLRKLRVEYKKNPSKELEDYIEKLAEQLKQTVSSYKVFSRLNMITSYFTLKNIDSQRSEGKFDTYEDAKEEALQYMKGININMLSRGMVQCEDTENYVHSLSFYLNIKEE